MARVTRSRTFWMAPKLMGTCNTEAQNVCTIRRPFPYVPASSPMRALEFIPIYGTRCLRGKEAHAMAGGQCRGLQSRLPAFLDIPSVTVDEFQRLMPSFEAAIQAPMGLCAPSIVSGCTSHSGT